MVRPNVPADLLGGPVIGEGLPLVLRFEGPDDLAPRAGGDVRSDDDRVPAGRLGRPPATRRNRPPPPAPRRTSESWHPSRGEKRPKRPIVPAHPGGVTEESPLERCCRKGKLATPACTGPRFRHRQSPRRSARCVPCCMRMTKPLRRYRDGGSASRSHETGTTRRKTSHPPYEESSAARSSA